MLLPLHFTPLLGRKDGARYMYWGGGIFHTTDAGGKIEYYFHPTSGRGENQSQEGGKEDSILL